MNTIDGFFTESNKVLAITEEDYRNARSVLTALDAFARMTYHSIYVIDYFGKNFLYVSENPIFLCGHSSSEVKEMGYAFYMQHVPEAEISMLMEINQAGFDFCARVPIEDRTKYTISYDFHILNNKRKTLINHKLTPLILSGDGLVWLAACVVSLSSNKNIGHVEVRKMDSGEHWSYSLEKHKWTQTDKSVLSDREKDILLLSARGYTMSEIADRLCMALDTVKFHKRTLFERLNTNNIVSALSVASNYKML